MIAFLWVPAGHSKIQGNKQVDRLTNTASVIGNIGDIDLTIGEIKSIIKNYSLKNCNEYWR